ncbi:MAG: class II aldolase/adducin family protein [Oligoflexales bacterium]
MRNPFPKPTPLQSNRMTEMIGIAENLEHNQWTTGHRSLSIRGSSSLVWLTREEETSAKLQHSSFVPYDMSTKTQVLPINFLLPPDVDIHAEIYRLYPQAQCVVFASMTSCFECPEHIVGHRGAEAIQLRCDANGSGLAPELNASVVDFDKNIQRLANAFPLILKPKISLLIVKRFGVYTWAKAPRDALKNLQTCESFCRTVVSTI